MAILWRTPPGSLAPQSESCATPPPTDRWGGPAVGRVRGGTGALEHALSEPVTAGTNHPTQPLNVALCGSRRTATSIT